MERDIVKRIEDLMDLFDEGEVTTADQIQRPEDPYRDFNERNPMAGGGMLVQPGFGGTRQGYKEEARFKKEGLETRVSNKVRDLIGKIEPINPKTGKVYTMKEYASLTRGQKDKLSARLRGKFKSKVRSPRLGYYPEKDANKLINFLKIAADKQKKNNVPLKERTFISVIDDGKFVGVRDVKANTLYTHIDYKGKRKGTSIAKHPSQDEVLEYLKQAKKFKFEKPEKLLRSYFSQYERVPTYSEIYNFFNRDRNAPIKSFQQNALEIHHRGLIEKMPDKNFQLVTMRKNTEANRILNLFNNKQITKQQADTALKKLGVNLQGMGKKDITTGKSIASAKRETVKLFKDALAKNPKLVEDITQKLGILAAKIDPNGCGRKTGATGGRIGLKFGSSECVLKAKNYLNQVVDRGIQNEPPARVGLIKKIISGTGNFIKQGLSPSELFKLENLVGKPALYATAAIESGLLADDVLRKKEPINVAAAENFLVGNLLNLDADAERAKNIINDPNLSPAAKTYAQGIIDQDNFRKLSQTYATNLVKNPLFIPSGAKAKADTALANLKNKITNTPETGRMDYESLLADKQDAFTAKEKPFDAPDKPGLPSFTSGQLEKRNVPGEFVIDPSFPLPLQKETLVPSYVSPSYSPERPEYEKDEFLNQYLKSIGEEPLRPGEGTFFRMNTPQLGLFGTQEKFARGGLSGGDTSGPPPERGPNPQGLPSLLKRVRNI